MSHGIRIRSEEEKKNAYAALCMMKWMCKEGKLPKAQFKNMVKLCSPYFDTSDFLSGVFFVRFFSSIFVLQYSTDCDKIQLRSESKRWS